MGFSDVARSGGFEPPTAWFVARYSIQLSYERAASTRANHTEIPAGVNNNRSTPWQKGSPRQTSVHLDKKLTRPENIIKAFCHHKGNHATL